MKPGLVFTNLKFHEITKPGDSIYVYSSLADDEQRPLLLHNSFHPQSVGQDAGECGPVTHNTLLECAKLGPLSVRSVVRYKRSRAILKQGKTSMKRWTFWGEKWYLDSQKKPNRSLGAN